MATPFPVPAKLPAFPKFYSITVRYLLTNAAPSTGTVNTRPTNGHLYPRPKK